MKKPIIRTTLSLDEQTYELMDKMGGPRGHSNLITQLIHRAHNADSALSKMVSRVDLFHQDVMIFNNTTSQLYEMFKVLMATVMTLKEIHAKKEDTKS